jgi:hypothetical protein
MARRRSGAREKSMRDGAWRSPYNQWLYLQRAPAGPFLCPLSDLLPPPLGALPRDRRRRSQNRLFGFCIRLW